MRQDELIESDRGPSSEWEGQWLHQAGLMGQVGREWVELKLLKACTGRAAGAKGFRRWEEKGKCEGRREGLALKWHQFTLFLASHWTMEGVLGYVSLSRNQTGFQSNWERVGMRGRGSQDQLQRGSVCFDTEMVHMDQYLGRRENGPCQPRLLSTGRHYRNVPDPRGKGNNKGLLHKSSIWSSSPRFTDRGKWRTWLAHHTAR